MGEYHVGCGAFGIYAGTLNSKNKNLWRNKSDVTNEAVSAVARYLLQENKSLLFDYQGNRYRLSVSVEHSKEQSEENSIEQRVDNDDYDPGSGAKLY